MPDRTAKALEVGAGGSTIGSFVFALTVWMGNTVDWLNDNYMAVIAVCTIITTMVSAYGSVVRIRATKRQRTGED